MLASISLDWRWVRRKAFIWTGGKTRVIWISNLLSLANVRLVRTDLNKDLFHVFCLRRDNIKRKKRFCSKRERENWLILSCWRSCEIDREFVGEWWLRRIGTAEGSTTSTLRRIYYTHGSRFGETSRRHNAFVGIVRRPSNTRTISKHTTKTITKSKRKENLRSILPLFVFSYRLFIQQ